MLFAQVWSAGEVAAGLPAAQELCSPAQVPSHPSHPGSGWAWHRKPQGPCAPPPSQVCGAQH